MMRPPSRRLRRRHPILESLESLNPVSSLIAGISPPAATSSGIHLTDDTLGVRAAAHVRLADATIRPLGATALKPVGVPSVKPAAGVQDVAVHTAAQGPSPFAPVSLIVSPVAADPPATRDPVVPPAAPNARG